MNDRHRTAEQARLAARAVLANLECLDGLATDRRARIVDLAQRLCAEYLDRAATIGAAGELRALLGPVTGLVARTVVSWLDDLRPVG